MQTYSLGALGVVNTCFTDAPSLTPEAGRLSTTLGAIGSRGQLEAGGLL